eukprot:TRINITY_DN21667_c0_g1_i1.p1 TRINITY_DN21667_c0_g1~~TRINITY_DN21667_c0_g1_i1.p1  ORF type:complete len:310 (+),score=73.82 TRINITY_DN21667_c0_g1_i1:19-948(+)
MDDRLGKASSEIPRKKGLDYAGGRKNRDNNPLCSDRRFEAQTVAREDYLAPPASVLRRVHAEVQEHNQERMAVAQACAESASAKLGGESSMRSDFKAPSLDALQRSGKPQQLKNDRSEVPEMRNAQFDGKSVMKQDFRAPPAAAVIGAAGAPAFAVEAPISLFKEAAPRKILDRTDVLPQKTEEYRFEGISETKQVYRPPPAKDLRQVHIQTDQLRQRCDRLRQEYSNRVASQPLDGWSSMKSDYQPPPLEALKAVGAEQRDGKGRVKGQRIEFPLEGHSQMRSDFKPPSRDALRQHRDVIPAGVRSYT